MDDPKPKPEVDKDLLILLKKVHGNINLSTDSQLTSSSESEFLSATEPTEDGLSDREKRKRTDPQLMAPIPGPESQLQDVKDRCVPRASTSLEKILTELEDLLMKHKNDIGCCTIAMHPLEVEPGAVQHLERARHMSPENAEPANQDAQPALPWHDSTLSVPLSLWSRRKTVICGERKTR